MKKITLLFQSHDDLWQFVKLAKPAFIQIKFNQKTLICSCNTGDVEMAIKKFNAKVIENESIS